ncbi:MAG: ribosome small subunit-dependent GTPase A [Flavobacteriaceae bacterium]|nr:ribosome small subunit-dependent GTPase A [Flavobacteriaceae bacterium]
MLKKGIIYKSTGIWHLVKSGNIFYKCRIKGKLRLHNSKSTSPVVVGDRVSFILDNENNSQGIIIEVQKRRNHIIRKSVKLSKQFQVIASNIDQIYLIITLNYPITFTQFIDRILVTAEAYRIPLNLVFNKMDLYSSSEKNEIKKLKNIYELIGYKCYKISALNKDSVNKVSKSMKNKVNMIIGHSGVGKSTLINTISPNLMIKTSNISDLHKQGQHTTTYSEMFDLSDKIKIIDTPGIKGFGLVDMDSNEIKNYFPEFKNLNGNCKYNNCLHLNEPNCAVINALNLNKISESRYKSYLNLIDENSTYRIK